MADRFSLLYRFLLDPDTNTWVDLTPQVNSLQTSITQNICSTAFKSTKDEATFVMPETPLFDAYGNETPKKKLIDKILSGDDILVQINAPGPVDVMWDDQNVQWDGENVQWTGSVRRFTGYVDRSSISLRSYPLPPNLTVRLYDVSVLHLDDKVDRYITLENKKISQIVAALLTYAGYTDIGSTALDVADDETLEAFVVDKDNAKTYRQYIDDLLFEAGGYVLDFDEYGTANVIHLQWDGSVAPVRTIDNPMNAEGIQMKSAYLKEDGVSVKWATLTWTGPDKMIYNADIQQGVDSDGNATGTKVPMDTFWPEGGETAPNYFQYQEERLDLPFFQNATKFKNDDISMIMAKDIYAQIDALRNGKPFSGWKYVDPTSWPAGDTWNDKYGIPTNPCLWPTKAFFLLFNPQWSEVIPNGTENPRAEGWFVQTSPGVYTLTTDTEVDEYTTYYLGATYHIVDNPDPLAIPVGEHWYEESGGVYTPTDDLVVDPNKTYYYAEGGDADIIFFTIYGNVLYRSKINVVDMVGCKNPKEYSSTYIYNQSHAERFTQFYWHFLQTSRFQFSWSEPNRISALNDIVSVGIKGNSTTQKALIAGKTSKWINDNVEIISYTAVGVDVYSPADLVPITIVPSNPNTPVQPITKTKLATFATTPSYTLAQWENFGTEGLFQSWEITNQSDFSVGDVALIQGVISDMEDIPVNLYMNVTVSEDDVISGTGIRIEYIPVTPSWSFSLSQDSFKRNLRYVAETPQSITASATVTGYDVTPSWTVIDMNTGNTVASGTGMTYTFTVAWDNAYTKGLKVQMSGTGMATVEKYLTVVDETDRDHDWGLWIPYAEGGINFPVPDHYTDASGILCAPVDGDYFVAQKSYFYSGASAGTPTSNPKAEGFYERMNGYLPGIYVATEDTSIDPGKTYYKTGGTSVLFKEGVPYIYDNNSWHNEMQANAANSGRLMRCLGNVLSDANVQPSTAALYAWFENLVAKNAVLENLVAMFLQVGPGTGLAGSGFRFRALNDDGNGVPVFDVYYGDKKVFQIDVTSGDILFGGGMIYHAASDTIEANNAVFNGIQINNTNGGEANFGSAIFQQQNPSVASYTAGSSAQGSTFFNAITAVYGVTTPGGNTESYSQWFACVVNSSVSGASNARFVRQVRLQRDPPFAIAYKGVEFADANYNLIPALKTLDYSQGGTDVDPFASADTVGFYYGGNIMKFVGLPTSSTGLTSGRVWNDGGTLKIVT